MTLASDWHDMHSSKYILCVVLLSLMLSWSNPSTAIEEEERLSTGHELNQETKPEHRVRPLPADTFKPTEEISEDYPVPFPVDI
jgi:hypothetical protein